MIGLRNRVEDLRMSFYFIKKEGATRLCDTLSTYFKRIIQLSIIHNPEPSLPLQP